MMEYMLIGMLVIIAFFTGMVAYHDIHVTYMNRARAKKRRQRDHRQCWCTCRVV